MAPPAAIIPPANIKPAEMTPLAATPINAAVTLSDGDIERLALQDAQVLSLNIIDFHVSWLAQFGHLMLLSFRK